MLRPQKWVVVISRDKRAVIAAVARPPRWVWKTKKTNIQILASVVNVVNMPSGPPIDEFRGEKNFLRGLF